MTKNTLVCLTVFLFFLGNCCSFSQTNQKEQQPLAIVLKHIEAQYNITFSYADENIKDKQLFIPPNHLSLSDVLWYLEEQTGLQFVLLDESSVIIKTPFQADTTTLQLLEEITVSNYLTRGITLRSNGTTQIKPQGFGILPGLIEPDVLQTIQALPAIQSADERISNLNVRGGTNDENLILWDGIKMYQSGHFFGLISAFNPFLIKDVIVSKNGSSAVYGDGVSSVIDMRSANQIESSTTSGIGINLINGDAYYKGAINKKMGLQLSARRSLTDLFSTPTYDSYFKRIFQDTDLTNSNTISQNERFYFYDVSAKFLYDISEKDNIRINALNIYNNLNYDEEARVNDLDEVLNSNLIQRNLALGITYNRKWNNNLSTSAQLSVSNYEIESTNYDVINDQRLIQENEVLDTALKLHISYKPDETINYFGGYQFSEVGISNLEDVNNPLFRRLEKEVIRTHSIFNEVGFSSTSKQTNARIGFRTNYIEKFSETYFEPRISFSQRFLSNFRFELLGELKSQTTSQIIDLQNDFLGVENRRWILSNNDDIPIIKSKQFSAGLHFNKNKLLVSVEAYIKDVEGITTRSQGFQNQYQFINSTGSYRIKGIDFLINKQIQNLSTWLSYSLSKNDYTFKDLNFGNTFPNNIDIRHAIKFGSSLIYNKLKFALGINWRSGKPFTQPDANNPITGDFINYSLPNSETISYYLRADVSATYNFKLGEKTKASAGFSVWNVTNNKNIINTYHTINDSNSINKIELESLGITPNFSFRVNF
ncbi:MAG: TonB-dependent receptor [Bacteroidetes bacterium]|nr:MAG: TonB-dependent receptor [Bacteroidota bacterium]